MELRTPVLDFDRLDGLIEGILRVARTPGAAIAIVADGESIFSKGYGYRDVEAKLPMTAETIYPIASTSKAMNTTILGMLVDDGVLSWDAPVQSYLPSFRLGDPHTSAQVTLRDLVTMRTGLPRHDWLWMGNPIDRAVLVERIRYVELSAGFRERYQYNNLTATAAGYIAEIVTGQTWEELVQQRIVQPLRMSNTGFVLPRTGNVTVSYHENTHRELLVTKRLATEVTAPSGGAIHSTVEDMTRWTVFNMNGGTVDGRPLIALRTLKDIHSSQVVVGSDPAAPSPKATYSLGWFVDSYNGYDRLSHGGYLHDVSSEVMLFPERGIGIVSFINFGPPRLARLLNEHALDLLMGLEPEHTIEDKLSEYEGQIKKTRARNASVPRVENTTPSHAPTDHVGTYSHPGYGEIEIHAKGDELSFKRHDLMLRLEHWHYDAWVVGANDLFEIHKPHAFDPTNLIQFETSSSGKVAALSIRLEPAVAPIRFAKD